MFMIIKDLINIEGRVHESSAILNNVTSKVDEIQ